MPLWIRVMHMRTQSPWHKHEELCSGRVPVRHLTFEWHLQMQGSTHLDRRRQGAPQGTVRADRDAARLAAGHPTLHQVVPAPG